MVSQNAEDRVLNTLERNLRYDVTEVFEVERTDSTFTFVVTRGGRPVEDIISDLNPFLYNKTEYAVEFTKEQYANLDAIDIKVTVTEL